MQTVLPVRPATRSLIIMMALFVAACASSPQRPQLIGERAQARWDSLLAGNVEEAYQYLSPGYRSSVSLEQYQRKLRTQKVLWTGAEYIDSDCLDSVCKVQISLNFSLVGVLPGVRRYNGKQEIDESWVNSEGKWWLVPEN